MDAREPGARDDLLNAHAPELGMKRPPQPRLPFVRRCEPGMPALAADHNVMITLPHAVGDAEPRAGADHDLRRARLGLAGLERRNVLRPEDVDPVRRRDKVVRERDRRAEDGLERIGVDLPGEIRDGYATTLDRTCHPEARAVDARPRFVAEGADEVAELGVVAVGIAPLEDHVEPAAVERRDREQGLGAADIAAQDEAPGHGCYPTRSR